MKVLQLCKKIPYPLKDGESVAVTYLARALNQMGSQVSLLSMNTSKHLVELKKIKPELKHYKQVKEVFIDNEVKPLHAFLNLFSSDSYNISRFESLAYDKALRKLLQKNNYDIVQLESLYLAPYIQTIRKYSNALVVLRAHNVEHEIWERLAENSDQLFKKWYLDHCARKLKKYEIDHLNQVDAILSISQRDALKFVDLGYSREMHYLPIGLDLLNYPFHRVKSDEKIKLSFIGSLDWMPNLEGLNWFLTEIWSSLETIYPNLELHVAGRNCPEWMHQLQSKNVFIHGEVADAKSFLLQYPVTIVPLQSGSGMRVKILEAMALGRIVISTSMGLEGIKIKNKQEALIADDINGFIQKINFCYQHKKHLPNISKKARSFVEANFEYIQVSKSIYDRLLQKQNLESEFLTGNS